MNGPELFKARVSRNWEQQETAAKLKVSQPYLSLIEAGKRPVTEKLARRAIRVFDLPPTALPVKAISKASSSKTEALLAAQLARLGYPKFSHLKKSGEVINPFQVLTCALETDELESRLVEALPWLIFNFSEMDWPRIFSSAKLADAQNRLGFLLSLAFNRAKAEKDQSKGSLFKKLLSELEKSKLVREDSFRRESLTETEKSWLIKMRPPEARRWRILSNLTADFNS